MKKIFREVLSSGASTGTLIALVLLTGAPLLTPATALAAEGISSWWPVNGAHLSGTQPLKAVVNGLDVSQYEMFWQVDGGGWNWMSSNYNSYPHKEAVISVAGWTWRGSGPYTINFIARKNGAIIAQYPVTVYVDAAGTATQTTQTATVSSPVKTKVSITPSTTAMVAPLASEAVTAPALTVAIAPAPTQPIVAAVAAPAPAPAPSISGNPLSGFQFYVNPNSPAAQQAASWQSSNPAGATMMQTLAAQPTASWFGEWNADVASAARNLVTTATAAGKVATLIAYAIPQRDCGGFSSGGTGNPSAYASWISALASGIGTGKAVVVLEPDSLAQITCLSSADQATRLSLLSNAVTTLKKNAGTKVYIDAGHSGWIDTSTMARRLSLANVAAADGFALNVSNFVATADEVSYGTAISSKVNGKHFIVDTSRNGNGSNGQWCNPLGRAIGSRPTVSTGNALVDAYLWLKVPGESDGFCNGGPSAGTWWPSYALSLVQNAR